MEVTLIGPNEFLVEYFEIYLHDQDDSLRLVSVVPHPEANYCDPRTLGHGQNGDLQAHRGSLQLVRD